MSDDVADPAGGEYGGLTPELEPAISPGKHIPSASSADVAAAGSLTAPEPAAIGAAAPLLSSPPEAAPFALPAALTSPPLPGDVSFPPPSDTAARPARRGRAGRVIALVVLIVVGVAGIGVGGTLLARELTRGPTKAEEAAAIQQEIASRWQRLSAGKIFTPALSYTTGGLGASFNATLVGIAPPASCAAALDPAMASLLGRYGCVTVLRATYLDYSGTEAVTIGLVIMKSSGAGDNAISHAGSVPGSAGLRTFPLPGTTAAQFGDAQRRYFSTITSIGRYVFLTVAGFTDGRVSGSGSSVPSLEDLGSGLTTSLESVMTDYRSACAMKDIRC